MDVKVLVIDDSPFIFKAVKRALEPQGYIIVGHAENGRDGLEMFDKHSPDIVTLDVTMPIMDGLETAEQLFKVHQNANIIMLSAMGDDLIIQKAKELGVKHFLRKPFKAKELCSVVEQLVEEA